MAGKKHAEAAASTEARFPYTNKPGSLRKLLKEIPTKPKPSKFDRTLLQSWGFRDANDHSMVRVLKAVNLLSGSNEPTAAYLQFMNLDGGPRVLGTEIKRLYAPLFTASHKPYEETPEKLKNLFNIHPGGGERALEYQMQTFKALCESASFDGQPTVNINLHIHLPENKTRRDYSDIIEDIGRYIFGRVSGDRRE